MALRMVAPETPAPALSASSSANSWEVVASDDDDGADVTGEEDDTPPHESDTRERRTEQTPPHATAHVTAHCPRGPADLSCHGHATQHTRLSTHDPDPPA